MLKNILKLNGAQQLTKNEQKTIDGGISIKSCPNGGWKTTLSICACNGGTYNSATSTCSSGSYTGNIWEISTGCCYSQLG